MLAQKKNTIFNSLQVIKDSRNLDKVPFFSILVRMKNEQKMLPYFLKSVMSQVTDYPYEIIFMDSGSQDETINIVNECNSDYLLYSINSDEFSFSKTCNFLVEKARAPYCILLSAHIELIGNDFLQRLGDFIINGSECGYFRQLVNHNNGYSLYDVLSLNKSFPNGHDYKIFTINDYKKLRFSNAGSFFKKEFAVDRPFPNVIASEDYLWAVSRLKEGVNIYYLPMLEIAHSHNESFESITKRVRINKIAMFGDNILFKKIVLNFFGIFLMLSAAGCSISKAFGYALAHAKGYWK